MWISFIIRKGICCPFTFIITWIFPFTVWRRRFIDLHMAIVFIWGMMCHQNIHFIPMNTWAEIKSIWNCSKLILYILTAVILLRQTGYVLCAMCPLCYETCLRGFITKTQPTPSFPLFPPPSLFSPFFPPPIHNPIEKTLVRVDTCKDEQVDKSQSRKSHLALLCCQH